jgi:hypothetical protein
LRRLDANEDVRSRRARKIAGQLPQARVLRHRQARERDVTIRLPQRI